jgi:hypothetical protein
MDTSKAVKKLFVMLKLFRTATVSSRCVCHTQQPENFESDQFIQNLLMGCQLDCLFLSWKTCNARLMVDSCGWKGFLCTLELCLASAFFGSFYAGERAEGRNSLSFETKLKSS